MFTDVRPVVLITFFLSNLFLSLIKTILVKCSISLTDDDCDWFACLSNKVFFSVQLSERLTSIMLVSISVWLHWCACMHTCAPICAHTLSHTHTHTERERGREGGSVRDRSGVNDKICIWTKGIENCGYMPEATMEIVLWIYIRLKDARARAHTHTHTFYYLYTGSL